MFRCEQYFLLHRVIKAYSYAGVDIRLETKEAVMSSSNPVLRNLDPHFGTLGVLWIVYGVIRLTMAACLLIYASTATLMFGALLNRVADPFTLMGFFHFLYTAMIA